MIGPDEARSSSRRWQLLTLRVPLLLLWAALAVPVLPAVPDAGADTGPGRLHRAAVIVDTGEQVKKVCVRFSEQSISGTELLERAQVDVVLRPYAGKGVAVCSLCGTGCRADDSCLTCDPDGRYWAYSRAAAGTSRFELSPAGASGTRVHDGDVEGWRWSHGSSPAFVAVAEVCDGATPPAPGEPATATTPATAGSAEEPVTTAPSGPATTTPPGPATTTATARGTGTGHLATAGTTASTAGTAVARPPASSQPAASSEKAAAGSPATALSGEVPEGEATGSPTGILAFGAVLLGLLTWAARARRRRRPTGRD